MHKKVYGLFEQICEERSIKGEVLEIGATPDEDSLLCMKGLAQATTKIGLNIDGPYTYKDFNIIKGNANNMDCFADARFDAVLCNAVLEHDKYFWKTIAEIYRVAKKGAVIAIGTPGYATHGRERKLKQFFYKVPGMKKIYANKYVNAFFTGTLTYEIHNAPGDYYRFSPQTYKEFFFAGCDDIKIQSILVPPRIIGSGIKR